MKKFTAIFLIVLQLLSHFHQAYAVTRLRTAVLSEAEAEETKAEAETETGIDIDYVGLGKACLGTLMDIIPPDFCWKKNSGFELPSECPAPYSKTPNGDCIEACRAGFKPSDDYKVCYKDCASFMYDAGDNECAMTGIYGRWPKEVYKPKSTFWFASKECKAGKIKIAGTCYNDCKTVGMVNCGPLGCADSDSGCKSAIAGMSLDVLTGILKGVITFSTLGIGTAVVSGLAALRLGGKLISDTKLGDAFKRTYNSIKEKLGNSAYVKTITDKALAAASKLGVLYLTDAVQKGLEGVTAQGICKPIFEYVLGKPRSEFSSTEVVVKALDVFDVNDVRDGCGPVPAGQTLDAKQKEERKTKCTKSILSTLSNVDPTGVLTVAAAFVQPTCIGI